MTDYSQLPWARLKLPDWKGRAVLAQGYSNGIITVAPIGSPVFLYGQVYDGPLEWEVLQVNGEHFVGTGYYRYIIQVRDLIETFIAVRALGGWVKE